MCEIAEIFVAEGIVTHVLDERTAISEGVRLFQILRASPRKSLAEQRLNVVLPQQVHDFFVREHRIRATKLRENKEQSNPNHRATKVEKSCHKSSGRPGLKARWQNSAQPFLVARRAARVAKKRSRERVPCRVTPIGLQIYFSSGTRCPVRTGQPANARLLVARRRNLLLR